MNELLSPQSTHDSDRVVHLPIPRDLPAPDAARYFGQQQAVETICAPHRTGEEASEPFHNYYDHS